MIIFYIILKSIYYLHSFITLQVHLCQIYDNKGYIIHIFKIINVFLA